MRRAGEPLGGGNVSSMGHDVADGRTWWWAMGGDGRTWKERSRNKKFAQVNLKVRNARE
jgi:hypothetical protein